MPVEYKTLLRLILMGNDGDKPIFRLAKDFVVSYGDELITVPANFETDLASTPRLPIVFMSTAFRFSNIRASVVHDYLYTVKTYPRIYADKVFYNLSQHDKDSFTNRIMWLGVRVFGKSHWKS